MAEIYCGQSSWGHEIFLNHRNDTIVIFKHAYSIWRHLLGKKKKRTAVHSVQNPVRLNTGNQFVM